MDGTQPTNLLNVPRFAAHSSRLPVLARKLFKRLEKQGSYPDEQNLAWIEAHGTDRDLNALVDG